MLGWGNNEQPGVTSHYWYGFTQEDGMLKRTEAMSRRLEQILKLKSMTPSSTFKQNWRPPVIGKVL
jgi:hypothetical protein